MICASGVSGLTGCWYSVLLRQQPQNAIAVLLVALNEHLDRTHNVSDRCLVALAPKRLLASLVAAAMRSSLEL
jgi:hypothetical protein